MEPKASNHKTFLFLNCSCCLCSQFSGWLLLHCTENLPSSPLPYIGYAVYSKTSRQNHVITCSSSPGYSFQGSAAHLQRRWSGTNPLGILLLSGPCTCLGPGDVTKAAEGFAYSVCLCWGRDFRTVTCELTFTFGTGGVFFFFSW